MQPQRLDLVYSVIWNGPWHIGSGFRSAATDRLIQRRGGRSGQPFIPGAQIKGVLRHACERLTLSLGLDVVPPHASSEEEEQELVAHFHPLAEKGSLIIDRLFGTRFQGDCLFVDSAVAQPGVTAGDRSSPTSAVRARTAMDRVTGTVKERHLFTTEMSDSQWVLQGTIRARHPAGVLTQHEGGFPYEYSLLVAGLLSIEAFGGDKSAGLGRCQITIDKLTWNGQQRSAEECLETFAEKDWKEMVDLLREEGNS